MLITKKGQTTHITMGPDELVGLEESATVDTEDGSGTVVLAEDSTLEAFFLWQIS